MRSHNLQSVKSAVFNNLRNFSQIFFNHELHELNEFIAAHNNRIYNKSHE